MTEREFAIMEANRINSEDGYFCARPQIDSTDRRRVFDAGFERGWEAATRYFESLSSPQPTPSDEVKLLEEDARRYRWLRATVERRRAVIDGSDCTEDEMDAAIDAAIENAALSHKEEAE